MNISQIQIKINDEREGTFAQVKLSPTGGFEIYTTKDWEVYVKLEDCTQDLHIPGGFPTTFRTLGYVFTAYIPSLSDWLILTEVING
jgi:hypothetical protein